MKAQKIENINRTCCFGCFKAPRSQFRYVKWYRSSYGAEFDNSEIADPDKALNLELNCLAKVQEPTYHELMNPKA